MAPSYEQKAAKIGEIHGTVNLGFKRPVHKGYMAFKLQFFLAWRGGGIFNVCVCGQLRGGGGVRGGYKGISPHVVDQKPISGCYLNIHLGTGMGGG